MTNTGKITGGFSSVTIEWKRTLTDEQLGERVLRVVKHANGEILRGKGIVADGRQGLAFHYLPGSLSIEPVHAAGGQACFIGTGLDEQQICTLFNGENA